MILVVRKVFSLENFPEGFELSAHETKGFGIVSTDRSAYIFAYPCIINQCIRIASSITPEDTYYISCKDMLEAEEKLQSMVLGFLVEYELRMKEGIRW
jgi:hypothetical protein